MFNDTDVRFNGTETRLPLTVKERKVTDGQREREKQRSGCGLQTEVKVSPRHTHYK